MCQHQRHPLHCIIPPYIADKISRLEPPPPEAPMLDPNIAAENRFRNKRKALAKLSRAAKAAKVTLEVASNPNKLYMEVYDAGQLPILPGQLRWKVGDKKTGFDKEIREVIRGGEKTWKFFKYRYKRKSLDDKGLVIIQTVHFRENPMKTFDNAMWDGEQMIYGDGDGQYYGSFTSDLDIIAHELTHGVIDYSAKLEYKNQSGALNESFADVFGIMVKQWAEKPRARKSNWLIGDNIMIGKKYALRSLKAPGTAYRNHPDLGDDPQPATMSEYLHIHEDFGGVHFNSGIPNYAFYVTAHELAGYAWEKAGAIWYAALTDKTALPPDSDFVTARRATIKKARQLFGNGSREMKAVIKGWDAAEVKD